MRPLEENFRILRLRVESQATLPATIVVSAAMRGDGTTYVACGLARAFAEAGHSTLLVDANAANPGVARELGVASSLVPIQALPDVKTRNSTIPRLTLASLSSPGGGSSISNSNLRELLTGMRADYAVTIVDAAPIPGSSTALQLAHISDGLVCAIRLGRRPNPSDHDVVRLLGEHRSRLIGIVPTRPASTRDADRREPGGVRANEPSTSPVADALRLLARRVGVGG